MSDFVPLPEAPKERPQEYVADISFDDMKLSPELRRAIAERGYLNPTPVQAKAFGPVTAGKDIIVRSKTGTGKTAAFGMPILEKIPIGNRGVRALIMCPTRELAIQVADELTSLAKYRDIQVAAIYGGASMKQQEDALSSGASIIVGTPGRVYDHIRRKNLKLDGCRIGVLDEADEMLNQGFYEEVTRILDCLPKDRQVLLFSATVPEDIQRLIAKYTTDAETLLLSGDVFTVEHIHHVRYDVSDAYPKPRNLLYMLELEDPDNAIIFCNTRTDTELVTAVLNRNGFDAELLNGDLPQKERERVMGRIKRGEVAFMVATDLAARGIDISDLGHVINYSLPEDPAVYLHRVGRTGRIGRKGTAINLISGRELTTFTTLEKKYGITFEKRQMPTPDEAATMWTERHVRELKEGAASAIYEGFLGLAATLKTRPDADELIAFMLKSYFANRRKEKVQASTEGEAPAAEGAEAQPPRAREDRGPREERSGRGRGDRGGRGERGSRERRPRREGGGEFAANSDSDATPVSQPAARRGGPSDRELFEGTAAVPPSSAATSSDTVPDGSAPVERRERRERPPRRERSTTPPRAAEPGQTRLWVNLGRAGGLDAAGVTAALEGAGAPAGKVAHVEVLNAFSFVFVPEGDVPAFEATSGKTHGERIIKVEKAKK